MNSLKLLHSKRVHGARSACTCVGRCPLCIANYRQCNGVLALGLLLSECFRYMAEVCGRGTHIHVRSRLADACPHCVEVLAET